MEKHQYISKLDSLLNTPERIEMYKTDASFHAGIEVLVRDGDVVDVLLQICKGAGIIAQAYRKHIEICPMPKFIQKP